MHAALKIAKTSVRSHAERKNLTVKMYSTPSGHAVAINTNEPNNTATPSEISSRDRPSGPPDPESVLVESFVCVGVTGAVVVDAARRRAERCGRGDRREGRRGVVGDRERERRIAAALTVGVGDEPRHDALALREGVRNGDAERHSVRPHLRRPDGDR